MKLQNSVLIRPGWGLDVSFFLASGKSLVDWDISLLDALWESFLSVNGMRRTLFIPKTSFSRQNKSSSLGKINLRFSTKRKCKGRAWLPSVALAKTKMKRDPPKSNATHRCDQNSNPQKVNGNQILQVDRCGTKTCGCFHCLYCQDLRIENAPTASLISWNVLLLEYFKKMIFLELFSRC